MIVSHEQNVTGSPRPHRCIPHTTYRIPYKYPTLKFKLKLTIFYFNLRLTSLLSLLFCTVRASTRTYTQLFISYNCRIEHKHSIEFIIIIKIIIFEIFEKYFEHEGEFF